MNLPEIVSPPLASLEESPAPRMLVIDDQAAHRTIIKTIGGKLGFATVEAASYDEATQIVQRQKFDCITLDLSLGRNYGIEIVRFLGEIGYSGSIVVVSGSGPSVAQLAISVGKMLGLKFSEPVPKPIDFALLKAELSRIKLECGGNAAVAAPA